MKKLNKKQIVSYIIIAFVLLLSFTYIYESELYSLILSLQGCNEYVLTPENCAAVFNRFPEEFMKADNYLYYYELGDFRTKSEIDSKGNLILRITNEQRDGWLEYISPAIAKAKEVGYVIPDDCTSFTISGDKAELRDKMFNMPVALFTCMSIHQLLTNDDFSEIEVECIIKDEASGIVLYSATYPKDDISISPKSLDYSKVPNSSNED